MAARPGRPHHPRPRHPHRRPPPRTLERDGDHASPTTTASRSTVSCRPASPTAPATPKRKGRRQRTHCRPHGPVRDCAMAGEVRDHARLELQDIAPISVRSVFGVDADATAATLQRGMIEGALHVERRLGRRRSLIEADGPDEMASRLSRFIPFNETLGDRFGMPGVQEHDDMPVKERAARAPPSGEAAPRMHAGCLRPT